MVLRCLPARIEPTLAGPAGSGRAIGRGWETFPTDRPPAASASRRRESENTYVYSKTVARREAAGSRSGGARLPRWSSARLRVLVPNYTGPERGIYQADSRRDGGAARSRRRSRIRRDAHEGGHCRTPRERFPAPSAAARGAVLSKRKTEKASESGVDRAEERNDSLETPPLTGASRQDSQDTSPLPCPPPRLPKRAIILTRSC